MRKREREIERGGGDDDTTGYIHYSIMPPLHFPSLAPSPPLSFSLPLGLSPALSLSLSFFSFLMSPFRFYKQRKYLVKYFISNRQMALSKCHSSPMKFKKESVGKMKKSHSYAFLYFVWRLSLSLTITEKMSPHQHNINQEVY